MRHLQLMMALIFQASEWTGPAKSSSHSCPEGRRDCSGPPFPIPPMFNLTLGRFGRQKTKEETRSSPRKRVNARDLCIFRDRRKDLSCLVAFHGPSGQFNDALSAILIKFDGPEIWVGRGLRESDGKARTSWKEKLRLSASDAELAVSDKPMGGSRLKGDWASGYGHWASGSGHWASGSGHRVHEEAFCVFGRAKNEGPKHNAKYYLLPLIFFEENVTVNFSIETCDDKMERNFEIKCGDKTPLLKNPLLLFCRKGQIFHQSDRLNKTAANRRPRHTPPKMEKCAAKTMGLRPTRKGSPSIRKEGRRQKDLRRTKRRSRRRASIMNVRVVAGGRALLPCDVTPHSDADSPQLIMWLKDGVHTPLFSVDFREGSRPQIWRDTSSSIAHRAVLHLSTKVRSAGQNSTGNDTYYRGYHEIPADSEHDRNLEFKTGALEVSETEFSDNGVYRCRVDFLQSPTKNARLNLTVIVPPDGVEIFTNTSRGWELIAENELGPLREGDEATLQCVTRHAWPSPRVIWLEEDSVLDTSWESLDSQKQIRKSPVGSAGSTKTKSRLLVSNAHWKFLQQLKSDIVTRKRDISSGQSDNNVVQLSKKVVSERLLSTGINYLHLGSLHREHHLRKLTCAAANNNLTSPATKSLIIKLTLPVLAVRLDSVPPLIAGESTEVQCRAWGSNPPPKISWSLGGVSLTAAQLWVSDDRNLTVSIATLVPRPDQDGKRLSCSAYNPEMGAEPEERPTKSLSDSTSIEVYYAPKVGAWLGRSLDARRIKEGDDVYFECGVSANPPSTSVTWIHQGRELVEGKGVLVSNMTLVLQKVNRSQAGKYVCKSTNKIGSSFSVPQTLDVKFAPVCTTDEAKPHSVVREENAHIACSVYANPSRVTFTWTFNNTAEVVNVPRDRYVIQGLQSVVNYTPMTDLDYGTLLCWAQNEIGKQSVPCVFQILPAGKPEPPHNCQMKEVTLSSLQVSCLPGDNGGDSQNFLLQVLETNDGGSVVAEVTRQEPDFFVANLRPSTSYRLVVTGTNRRGQSRATHLTARTAGLHPPRHETSAEPTRGRESSHQIAVGVIAGSILAGLTILGGILAVLIKGYVTSRGMKRENERADHTEDSGSGTGQEALRADKRIHGDEDETEHLLRTVDCPSSLEGDRKAFLDTTLPPPLGYNQGYFQVPKAEEDQIGCLCASNVGCPPNEVVPYWNDPTMQLASCGYTLSLFNDPHNRYSGSQGEYCNNTTASVHESSPDILKYHTLISKPKDFKSSNQINQFMSQTLKWPSVENRDLTSSDRNIRCVTFADKSESSV